MSNGVDLSIVKKEIIRNEKSITNELTSENNSESVMMLNKNSELMRVRNLLREKSREVFKAFSEQIDSYEHLKFIKEDIKKMYKNKKSNSKEQMNHFIMLLKLLSNLHNKAKD
jgi:histidyl-tRNA synthetase